MPSHREQFQGKIKKIIHIWLFARDAYYFAEYFHNPDTPEEVDYVTNSRDKYHLDFMRHLMYRTLVIELCKLFCNRDGDSFNVFKLIASLKPSGHHRSLKFDPSILEQWEEQLKIHKPAIDKIVTLRDEYYAHEDDSGTDLALLDVGFKEIERMLDIVWNIIQTVESVILNTHFDAFVSIYAERESFHFLRTLAVADKRRTAEINKKYIIPKEEGRKKNSDK